MTSNDVGYRMAPEKRKTTAELQLRYIVVKTRR